MKVRLKHRKLAAALAESSISLNRWAQKIGVSSGHLSQMVNGRRVYLRAETRRKLLDALGLSFQELFEIEEERRRHGLGGLRRGRLSWSRGWGPLIPEETTAMKWISHFRFALRQMRRRKGFTAAAVLTLMIGIGSGTALFSLVNTILWKPFPYQDPEEIVRVLGTDQRNDRLNFSYPDFEELRDGSQAVFSHVAAHDWEPFSLAGGDQPIRVGGGQVSASLFQVLGVQPIVGRVFGPDEDRPGAARVLVLREALWRTYFGADPDIAGRTVQLNGQPATILGVLPDEAQYPHRVDLWIPLGQVAGESTRGATFLQVTARLNEGVSPQQAGQALESIAASWRERFPQLHENRGIWVQPLREEQVRNMKDMSAALLGVVVFVLLIVCANVANLLLARGVSREREFAVRSALGAGRMRLVQQLFCESLLLAGLGGLLGCLVGLAGVRLMMAAIPVYIPAWVNASMDWRILAFVLSASLFSALVFGLLPALQGTRQDLIAPLRGERASGGGRKRLRSMLVVGEVALSVALLVGAGLMIRQVQQLSSIDPGFETDGRLTAGMDLLTWLDRSDEERTAHVHRLIERLQALPGAEAVAAVDRLSFKGSTNMRSICAQGQSSEECDDNPGPIVQVVSPDYFKAMGIPILRGRTFDGSLNPSGREAIVSQSLAEALWPDETALGQSLRMRGSGTEDEWMTVVAVVQDSLQMQVLQRPWPLLYLPYQDNALGRMSWVVKARPGVDPLSLSEPLRQAVASVDPLQPVHEVMTLQEVFDVSIWSWRFFGSLFRAFAGVALILAAVGLYGVMAYSVSERRMEMGIRMALGAKRRQVITHVLRQGGILVAVGSVLGLLMGLGAGTLLSNILYRVAAFEPWVYLAVVAVMFFTALLALFLPARRASRYDPAVALRADG
ncbi:MAG TPA: ADOP family duplicated permease [Acidobacteriota bacterium]|nr:ADOP family duplicated permease [Acidobacteriota bacterium]